MNVSLDSMETELQNPSHGVPPIVLLVEDDPDTRNLYETALEYAGLWVAPTADPADALEYAADLRPDTVVMDVEVPTLREGLALAKAFRESPRTTGTPLVGVTALDPSKVRPGAALFTRLFYKPVRIHQLVRQVKWLSTQSAVLRERSELARAKVPALLARSNTLLDKSHRITGQISDGLGRTADALEDSTLRTCPKCRKPLLFSERRIVDGTTFDYYLSCRNGCGMFCYDHSRRKLVILV